MATDASAHLEIKRLIHQYAHRFDAADFDGFADLFANGRLIARGEVVAIDEEYGLRVTEVLATPHGVRDAA